MLSKKPFSTQDAVRGDDSELYHLPTLIALYRAGRLDVRSVAYSLVLQAITPRTARLTA